MQGRGGRLSLLALSLFTLSLLSRPVSPVGEPPAFFVASVPQIQVALVGKWSSPGIHQFFDDTAEGCVNQLTQRECQDLFSKNNQLLNGAIVGRSAGGKVTMEGWFPAAWRMSLQIPLHPDRMSEVDWLALTGFGPFLARAVDHDRQINGDFGSFKALQRVKGVGEKRLKKIDEYFSDL